MAESVVMGRRLADRLVEELARTGVAADDRAVLRRAHQDATLAPPYLYLTMDLHWMDGLLARIKARRSELRAEARARLARDVALTRPIL